MSWMYGTDYLYAHSRLEGTIVRWNNRPVTVGAILGGGNAVVSPLEDGPAVQMTVEARELDCTPVPLGYVNSQKMSVYCSRMPARRYRQGLSEVTLSCTKNGGAEMENVPLHLLVQCITNDYPPYEECVAGGNAKAWHRDWASSSKNLYYKGGLVGVTDKNKGPVLNEKYTYLQEALDEDFNGLVPGKKEVPN
jgi:hypothetical protein